MEAIYLSIEGRGVGTEEEGTTPSCWPLEHMCDVCGRRRKNQVADSSDTEWSATDLNDVPSPVKKKSKMSTTREYVEWDMPDTDALIDIMVGVKQKNPRASFIHAELANKVFQRTGHRYREDQVKSKVGRMKALWKAFDKMMKETGMGFDPLRRVPTCGKERFAEYCVHNKLAKKFEKAPLHWEEEMDMLFRESTATGHISHSSGVPVDVPGSSRGNREPDPTIPHIAVPRIPPRTRDAEMKSPGSSKRSRSEPLESIDTAAKVITEFNTKMIQRMDATSYSAGKPSKLEEALKVLGKFRKLLTYRQYSATCNRLTNEESCAIFMHHKKKKDKLKWIKETSVPPSTGYSSSDSEYDPNATLEDISD